MNKGLPVFFWRIFFSVFFISICHNGYSQNSAVSEPEGQISINDKDPETVPHFTLKNENATIGKKWLHAEKYIGGLEFGTLGILMMMPPSVTKWESGFIDDALGNLKEAFTRPPIWDKDDFSLNYIAHPYCGAVYYNAIRSQGATKRQSFIYTAVQSTIWEYVIEGVAERPSIQDLIITPAAGYFMGEMIHKATLKMRRNGFTFLEKIAIIILNPMYVANNSFRTPRSIVR